MVCVKNQVYHSDPFRYVPFYSIFCSPFSYILCLVLFYSIQFNSILSYIFILLWFLYSMVYSIHIFIFCCCISFCSLCPVYSTYYNINLFYIYYVQESLLFYMIVLF